MDLSELQKKKYSEPYRGLTRGGGRTYEEEEDDEEPKWLIDAPKDKDEEQYFQRSLPDEEKLRSRFSKHTRVLPQNKEDKFDELIMEQIKQMDTRTNDYEVGGYSDIDVLHARKQKSVNQDQVDQISEEDPFEQMMEQENKATIYEDDEEESGEDNTFLEEAVQEINTNSGTTEPGLQTVQEKTATPVSSKELTQIVKQEIE